MDTLDTRTVSICIWHSDIFDRFYEVYDVHTLWEYHKCSIHASLSTAFTISSSGDIISPSCCTGSNFTQASTLSAELSVVVAPTRFALLEPTPVTELGLSCFLLGNDHSRGENVLLDALKLPSYGPIEHWRVDLHATGEILVVDALQPQ